jgi:hypothetical protein
MWILRVVLGSQHLFLCKELPSIPSLVHFTERFLRKYPRANARGIHIQPLQGWVLFKLYRGFHPRLLTFNPFGVAALRNEKSP